MAIKVSTGLRAGMMNSSGAKEQLDGGLIKVLSGTPPADADAAQTGTVLWTISVNGAGTGLTWETNGAEIRKLSGATWQGATTAGTATYFRVVGPADTGALSTTQPRIQGTVGLSAVNDMVLSSSTFVTDASTNSRVLGAASFSSDSVKAMLKFSTGLRNALAADYGLGAMMNGGVIRVYGGIQPASPDLAPGTPMLGIITTDGNVFIPFDDPNDAGLMLQFIEPGGLMNLGAWVLKGIASGTASWFRWHWKWEDDLGDSSLYPRVDGDIGLTDSSSALRLSNRSITSATTKLIETFVIQLTLGD